MISTNFQRNLFQEHKELMDAVLAKDKDAASDLLRRYYERTVTNFQKHAEEAARSAQAKAAITR